MSIFKAIVILAIISISACTDTNNGQGTLTCSEQSTRSCVSFLAQCMAIVQEGCWAADLVCTHMCGSTSDCGACHKATEKACSDGMEVCGVYDAHCSDTLTSICENQ